MLAREDDRSRLPSVAGADLWQDSPYGRLPPPVLSELLSKPDQTQIETLLTEIPLMELAPGLWDRAGQSRRVLRTHGLKAALADALIAQCCLDADVLLIARDRDYRHFARGCGLKLAS